MAINKKLIHFKTKANFNTQLEAGNILDTSIVYIQDAKEIYTHGTTYGTCLSEEQIETIIANSDTIADVLALIIELETTISTNLNTAKAYTDQKIADLVGQAPEALNTVYELASAMTENQDTIDTLEAAVTNKVDKVSGKGLSTNDYTTNEKNKLAGIATGAQVNTITGVKGSAESVYRTGNVEITKANIGLANVDNTADANKSVNYANTAGSATTATKATLDSSGNVITSTYATKGEVSTKQDVGLKFFNVSAETWVEDGTYVDFGYRCDLRCSGVTSDMYAEVIFSMIESTNGKYAPVCETKDGIVSIWSSDNTAIVVPTIVITK